MYCALLINYLHIVCMNAGSQGPSEQEILAVYKSNSEAVFHEGAFNYAKALCCLRWISVFEVQCIHIRICTYMHRLSILVLDTLL